MNKNVEKAQYAAVTTVLAAHAISALERNGRSTQIVGCGTPPIMPYIHHNGWTLNEILKSDLSRKSIIQREILRRIEIVEKAGIEYTHILVGHEPKREPKTLPIPKEVHQLVWKVLGTLALATVGLAALVVGVIALLAILPFLIFGLAVLLAPLLLIHDPVVILVLKDENQTWLEIARWYD